MNTETRTYYGVKWTVQIGRDGEVLSAKANVGSSFIMINRKHGANIGRHGFRPYKRGPRYYAMLRMKPTSSLIDVQTEAGSLHTFTDWHDAAVVALEDVRAFHGE